MHHQSSLDRALRCAAAGLGAALLCALPAGSATVTDGVATITASDTHGGLTEYSLGGTDHLFEIDYYFRTGSMTAEDMMTGVNSTYVNSVTTGATSIMVQGATSEFDFSLLYALDGTGDMLPTLDITNTTASTLDIALFNYQDWDVNGTPNGDRLTRVLNTIQVRQGSTVIEVHPVQGPDAIAASTYSTLRDELRDGSATTLTDGAGLPYGPGDATFAFQFSITLAAGETTTVIYSVPEPSTGLMGLMGLAGLAWTSRKRPA